MIKTVIFDIGGVLDKGNVSEHYSSLCKALKINPDKFYKIWHKYSSNASAGKITTKQFISSISKEMGLKSKDLLKNWIKCKRKALIKNKDVERTIKKLKLNGYKLGTLTDVNELHHKLRIEKKFYDLFDFQVCSFKDKVCKPNMRAYKLILKRMKASPEESVFIDDVELLLKPAKKLGMKTIQFKNNKQLVRDLRKLNIKI